MKKEYFNPNIVGQLVDGSLPDMSTTDHEFILYLLNKYKPKRILEVGVASGATSCLLLRNTPISTSIVGIDLDTHWYKDRSKPIGWQIKALCSDNEVNRYRLFTDKDPIEVMPELNKTFDFCVLDTTHVMPGECLTFFALYKYLEHNSILVLHDISLNYYKYFDPKSITTKAAFATKLLFTVLGSKTKMLPQVNNPNIGALVIDSQTRRTIHNAFFALGITWFVYPESIISKYREYIKDNYDEFCLSVFDQCIRYQKALAYSIV